MHDSLVNSAESGTRSKPSFFEPYAVNGSSWSGKTFEFLAPRVYNSLPLELRSSGSIGLFKTKLKEYLIEKSFKDQGASLTPYAVV